ncbi:MAG: 16S rRNA (cytidine(1402)-2'-O)-methyltransferase [Bacteroidales bacterium]|nr:16S rRNA (cytidine(1402)-2'-O)-methyltransferase [Bacteroidales bacterium]MBN2698990.1 16S rRNA (cytidine(1402)-2'-O)-methyltransferase [Bacteroidales bacterium]
MSKLFLVPTPIGNLADMTFRAVDVLKSADLILAEDTRKSAVLLKHYGIFKPIQSHHKFNEHHSLQHLVRKLLSGTTIALISDAGTPGVSDPGFLLVRECINHQIEIETLPGATAFIPALVNSGLPMDRFIFEGFLPQKKGRQKRLKELENETRTMIFYESPYRLLKTLEQIGDHFSLERPVSVSRELSKIHEETIRGTLKELIGHFSAGTIKGEIVIVVGGKERA